MAVDIPIRMRHLEVDPRLGLPVPWFVDRTISPVDFRIADGRNFGTAIKRRLCWVCGGQLGAYLAFAIGPMCAINRTTAEPPAHLECAHYSVKACPFLSHPRMKRSPRDLPANKIDPGGLMIERNPGVVAIWIARDFTLFTPQGGAEGTLIRLGNPRSVEWWTEGRPATRAEVMESIESGFPLLLRVAERDGAEAIRELWWQRREAERLLPVAA